MTNLATKQDKNSPVYHEAFVKTPEVKQEKIDRLVEMYQLTEEVARTFYKVVNWISVNNNKKQCMKFFKNCQCVLDARLVTKFEYQGVEYIRLSQKGLKIVSGYEPKIKVDQQKRTKIKVSKGWVSTNEIGNKEVADFLANVEYKVKRERNQKGFHILCIDQEYAHLKKVDLQVWIYENDVKLAIHGENKQYVYDMLKESLKDFIQDDKMAFSYGFIHLKKADLCQITKEMMVL